MSEWEEAEARSQTAVAELRGRIVDDASAIMVFLGAGLSAGVGRPLGRATFEMPPPLADDARFPSWSMLVERMLVELRASANEGEAESVERFIREQSPLDAAQLFRLRTAPARYRDFLMEQFVTRLDDAERLTPSHRELVALPIRDLFTTNYDSLIELAFERGGRELAVSTTPAEFLHVAVDHPDTHLVKLHGTWEHPDEIVLTRDDYARSRLERAEMFRHVAQTARFSSFLFIGFSLSDPNFNLIRDEARAVMGDAMPTSYLVQQRVDPVMREYLGSLDVKVVELFSWNELPGFLRAINPERDPAGH
jgi:hypothetical protein